MTATFHQLLEGELSLGRVCAPLGTIVSVIC
jgi:hypothetical protein